MKAPLDHAKALLKKAANDLIAAEAILDTVCFHAQQAVEKSQKAILAFHDVSYPWRHDLGELVNLVKPLAPQIAPLEDRILRMTPYAVEARYDDKFDPLLVEASQAFATSHEVYALTCRILE